MERPRSARRRLPGGGRPASDDPRGAQLVDPFERAARVVQAQAHRRIDVGGRGHPLAGGEGRLVGKLGSRPVPGSARRAGGRQCGAVGRHRALRRSRRSRARSFAPGGLRRPSAPGSDGGASVARGAGGRTIARPRGSRRCRSGPSARTAPSGSRRPSASPSSICAWVAVPSSRIRSDSSANGRLQRLTMKPGRVGAAHGLAAHGPRHLLDRLQVLLGRVGGRDHLDELHQRRGVEEVHPADPLGVRAGRRRCR